MFKRKIQLYTICDDTIWVYIVPNYKAGRFTTWSWTVADVVYRTVDGIPVGGKPFDHGLRQTKRECRVAAYNAALKHTDDAA
jgi:hypothetical protein